MLRDKFTNIIIGGDASEANPKRLEFDGKKYISTVIKNTSLSGQVLWIGVNSDQCIEPLSPGESFAIASREGAYLSGYIAMAWTDNIAAKNGIITVGVDEGEAKNC
jgi:hypothetical protein